FLWLAWRWHVYEWRGIGVSEELRPSCGDCVRGRGGVVNVTREDVLSLSGRELDAAVAERVLGWKRGDLRCGDMPWYPPGTGRYLGGGRMDLPEFSTDISAAWEVVEHLATPDEALT